MRDRKPFLAVLLTVCLLFAICPPVYAADGFTDVPADAEYAAAVYWAKETGVTEGTGVSTFSPDRTATRAEAVTFLWRSYGSPAPAGADSGFADLAEDWYRDAVLWAKEEGITEGTTEMTFSPDEPVSRTEMAAFLYRAAGEPGKTGEGEWYADAARWALGRILIFGDALPLSSSDDALRRADAVDWLYRLAKAPEPEANGDIVILYTSDVHCGIAEGFGYAGLAEIRSALDAQGYTTILVDDGDAVQGEALATLSKGEALIDLMNAVGYDIAIPGNHEFDYGMDRFFELVERAEFPYLSCNFNHEGDLVFEPYTIVEAAGKKIAFVGIATPDTLTSSTPSVFQNEEGEYIYGFFRDATGEGVYTAVQTAIDAAKADGADYIYVLGHMGDEAACIPWTYADVIEHTTGIDVFFDGHSHDAEQVVMRDMDGRTVVRSACGTKLANIGYSHISADGTIVKTGIWNWRNETDAPEVLGIRNAVRDAVDSAMSDLNERLATVVARSSVLLTINDAVATDTNGNPIRMVRRAETNLGDLCADAVRAASGADVALMNGGGIRKNIKEGDITYGDIINVFPFGNALCVIEATGQQILDALEWGARAIPGETGGFLQVSGLSYEADASVPSGCLTDDSGLCSGIEGARRVRNVRISGVPLDPEKTYTVAGFDYTLLANGDGFTAFDGATVLQNRVKLDNQLLIDYITETLGGEVGAEYADPYGEGRITILGN